MSTPIQASVCQLREKDIIAVRFEYDKALISRFRQLPGARWSNTLKCWYLPDTADYRKRLGLPEKDPVGKDVLSRIDAVNLLALQRMEQQLILKNYSLSTRKTYLTEFAQLLYVLKSTSVDVLSHDQLRNYCSWCLTKQHISANQLHSRINAIKFYYEQVCRREGFFFDIPRLQKPITLPKV